jgi:hypothetical protein
LCLILFALRNAMSRLSPDGLEEYSTGCAAGLEVGAVLLSSHGV